MHYVNLDRRRKPSVGWPGPAPQGLRWGVAAITRQISFVSTLPAENYHQLEVLLFFNGRQHRVRKGIETAIDRYGAPEIVSDGRSLRVQVGGETHAQCLFAVERDDMDARPVGVVLYVRDSFERITVLHLVVAEAYAVGGPRAGYNLALRLVQAVKRVARRTTGIRHIELLYSQDRARAAFA